MPSHIDPRRESPWETHSGTKSKITSLIPYEEEQDEAGPKAACPQSRPRQSSSRDRARTCRKVTANRRSR